MEHFLHIISHREIPVIITTLVMILGCIAEYLAEHKQLGANITNLGDGSMVLDSL